MLFVLVVVSFTTVAQAPPPPAENVGAPPAGAPAKPAPAETAPPAKKTSADKLEEAARIVEEGKNTRQNLHRALELYAEALHDPSITKRRRALALTDMSRAKLRLGDLATKKSEKLAHYEAGKAFAARAQSVDPELADAHFWEAANMATIGRTRGVVNSLFMIDDLKARLSRALELDPNHHYARETMGSIYHAVPGMLGGDDDKAEDAFKEVLRRDPDFTPTKVTYAQFLVDDGRDDEACKLLKSVVNAKRSSVPHDWRKFNKRDARQTMRSINGCS